MQPATSLLFYTCKGSREGGERKREREREWGRKIVVKREKEIMVKNH